MINYEGIEELFPLKHYAHMWFRADVEIINKMSGNIDFKKFMN